MNETMSEQGHKRFVQCTPIPLGTQTLQCCLSLGLISPCASSSDKILSTSWHLLRPPLPCLLPLPQPVCV